MHKSSAIHVLASATLALAACRSKPLDAEAPDLGAAGQGGAGVAQASIKQLVLDDARISSDPEAVEFQQVGSSVDFGKETVARATLSVDLRSPCFPFSNWSKLGVPPGQRWPAECDAFDRTVQVTLDDPEGETPGMPALELIRAVTPFGGPEHLEADITDIVNGLPGAHRLAVHLGTWSDAEGMVSGSHGEWYATASLEVWPGPAPRRVLAVLPLIFENQTEADSGSTSFVIPSGVGSARLEYRATGHGGVSTLSAGCRGPAEEFCRRSHQLLLDGDMLAELEPWRDDCDSLCNLTTNADAAGPTSYCAENPCGDPDSVRASRANWCPGSTTPPYVVDAPSLTASGSHELTRSIDSLAAGGLWTVSATYIGFE